MTTGEDEILARFGDLIKEVPEAEQAIRNHMLRREPDSPSRANPLDEHFPDWITNGDRSLDS